MTRFSTSQVKAAARQILENYPNGLRWAELFRQVCNLGPDTPHGTVQGSLRALRVDDREIVRPTKGLWVLAKYADGASDLDTVQPSTNIPQITLSEADFYQPFADWLRDEAEEAVETLSVGGSVFRWKWGTPDVVGVNKHRPSDAVRLFSTEIVAAEIKIDAAQTVTAFGQACAYRLFAHKVYIAMPASMHEDDRDRLETLCGLFGIGLVEFKADPAAPEFDLRVRAQRFEPDRFYVNRMAEVLKSHSQSDFDRLFG